MGQFVNQDWVLLGNHSRQHPLKLRHLKIVSRLKPKKHGTVWYDNKGIINILSMSKAKNEVQVRYDRTTQNKFFMTKPDEEVYFHQGLTGLYLHYTNNRYSYLITV